jgi:hypothetical protein
MDLTIASSRPGNEARYSRRSRFIRPTMASDSAVRPCLA